MGNFITANLLLFLGFKKGLRKSYVEDLVIEAQIEKYM